MCSCEALLACAVPTRSARAPPASPPRPWLCRRWRTSTAQSSRPCWRSAWPFTAPTPRPTRSTASRCQALRRGCVLRGDRDIAPLHCGLLPLVPLLLQGELVEVKNIMIENIEKVLERGEKLDLLVDKTDSLQDTAATFRREARRLKRTLWWRVRHGPRRVDAALAHTARLQAAARPFPTHVSPIGPSPGAHAEHAHVVHHRGGRAAAHLPERGAGVRAHAQELLAFAGAARWGHDCVETPQDGAAGGQARCSRLGTGGTRACRRDCLVWSWCGRHCSPHRFSSFTSSCFCCLELLLLSSLTFWHLL